MYCKVYHEYTIQYDHEHDHDHEHEHAERYSRLSYKGTVQYDACPTVK